MEFHGGSMELHEVPSMELHVLPWNLHEILWTNHGIPWTLHGTSWSSMEFHEFSIEFHGIPWSSMEFHGVPWSYFTRVTWSVLGNETYKRKRSIEITDSDLKVHALHYANELLKNFRSANSPPKRQKNNYQKQVLVMINHFLGDSQINSIPE